MIQSQLRSKIMIFVGLTVISGMLFPAFKEPADLKVVLAHGFGDTAKNALSSHVAMYPGSKFSLWRQKFFFKKDIVAVDFDDQGSLFKTTLGQAGDINEISHQVTAMSNRAILDGHSCQPFVGVGHSRGGSALISYTGLYNPENLQALVVRGAPSSMPGVVSDILGGWIGSQKVGKGLLAAFSKYPLSDLTPQSAISRIKNKDLPVIVMHHAEDKVVNVSHGHILYDELQKNGFKNSYFVPMQVETDKKINDSSSLGYCPHNASLSKKDFSALQSIYKILGLPHQSSYATYSQSEVQKLFQPKDPLYVQPSRLTVGNAVVATVVVAAAYLAYSKYKKMKEQKA